MSNLVQQSSGSITSEYIIDNSAILGSGMTCEVKKITHRHTGKQYALKAIRLNRLQQDKIDDLRREIEIMKALDHPNIIWLHEIIDDLKSNHIYLVTTWHSRGTIEDLVKSKNNNIYSKVGL